MGIFGLGKDDDRATVADGPSTDPSTEPPTDPEDGSALNAAATAMVDTLLGVGIDGAGPFDSARQIADVALAEHPDTERAVDAVVGTHLRMATAGGFVTGLGGIVTLPVALPANILEFYVLATRMVAGVATARGYDTRKPEVRSAVLLTLVGADSDDLLRKAGVTSTGRLANLAGQRLPAPAMMVINKGVGFRLVSQVGQKALARFGKAVPLLGGVVGAGLDRYLMGGIADHARREFPLRVHPVGR